MFDFDDFDASQTNKVGELHTGRHLLGFKVLPDLSPGISVRLGDAHASQRGPNYTSADPSYR